jgi:DNA repair protein RadC
MKLMLLNKIDLPREKIEKYGTKKLSDHELLAVLLGSGIKGVNVVVLAKKVLKLISHVGKDKISINHLLSVRGLGKIKSLQILSLLELIKRLNKELPQILSSTDIWKACADIRSSKKEHLVAFYLDTQNRVIAREIVSIGTLSASIVHPREVFEPAVKYSAASIILAHNHPSGYLGASDVDNSVTQKLKEAGILLGISINDHLVVTNTGFTSII